MDYVHIYLLFSDKNNAELIWKALGEKIVLLISQTLTIAHKSSVLVR